MRTSSAVQCTCKAGDESSILDGGLRSYMLYGVAKGKKKNLAKHVSEMSEGTVHREEKSQVICKQTGTDNQNGFPGGSVVKNLPATAGDVGSISGSGRSAEEGNGNPLQYSCLGNPTVRGAWWAAVRRVARV